jgi:hypothetical protein
MKNTQQEISAICINVNQFTSEMKGELILQVYKGKRGWDTHSAKTLCALLRKKMEEYNSPDLSREEAADLLIDIANLSMFVRNAILAGR